MLTVEHTLTSVIKRDLVNLRPILNAGKNMVTRLENCGYTL